MIDRIIEFSIRNKLVIGLFTLALIVFGVYSFQNLPVDAVPDITNNQVQVVTSSPSLAPQEVEQFITFPVEMAMANIQNVVEIRSISRFGLSVVTIVFKDRMDIHLARQLVKEQIDIAAEQIPEGYGSPQMMPVTTGLGEIYQYVIQPQPGYEDKYDLMELRTVHDWIVKRYLAGIPGIVEISSFGGLFKQYEVSVIPRNLVALDVTLDEIYKALQDNNQNTGGSYIEKNRDAYYIRTEGLLQSLDDIRSIVVKENNGVPVIISDLAEVKFGAPKRYGAMTKDGKGEVVGGITLMLKGANTSEVLEDVKERVAEIQDILPEGLLIEPYLDRSGLIEKTTNTVTNNLMEGGLIVIFVLILLLGSYRSGLIVASVIPLSMMFAFIMMRIFGVTANLMSLGAIDFGLIVDGAVIIVEGIVYRLQRSLNTAPITMAKMDNHVLKAGKSVGRSATFGVFIILLVYIPILAFTGIEGKTFRPMAQTVIFALLGALILSLTYVPVVSSLFLSKKIKAGPTFSSRLIGLLNRSHAPVLLWALRNKIMLLVITVLLFLASMFSFSKLGGVFIPTLEEGDLAVQMTISPGSSLTQSIETSTKAEKILLEQFPEVISVVSKIGTAEVPTDPMAIEDADIMIVMQPKKEWVSANTREELVEKMKRALVVVPGAAFEFTQPIQLRFNELMTGVKSDIAIKIYGESLDVLDEKARIAASLIENVEGAADVRVEQVTGLPQLVVKIKRDMLAMYGLTVEDVNRTVRTAFAGESAGVVFEGEKRFDLVVRLKEEYRNNVQVLENLRINRPGGELVHLRQVADIEMEYGPMQISRDDAKRRINIGVNVRNRDVESLVDEIRNIMESDLSLPPGYRITYGGQFENLQAAKRTSAVAVPIALLLILVFLYFAFSSVKQALMVFSAIPLAAMGGIWSLWARGMPFSISAGVGFIVLFGIVVLNGIVLISYYNELEKTGIKNIHRRVVIGTRRRIRPVLLTAATDILGFLPMAISTAPGAEVQKPLATVVIGGLLTATFLTLVLLPAIYALFSQHWSLKKIRNMNRIAPVLFLFFITGTASAQDQVMTFQQALNHGVKNNVDLKVSALEIEAVRTERGSFLALSNPEIAFQYGQINGSMNDFYSEISQGFQFPGYYLKASDYHKSKVSAEEKRHLATIHQYEKELRILWSEHLILRKKRELVNAVYNQYQDASRTAVMYNETGETSALEMNLTKMNLSEFRLMSENLEREKYTNAVNIQLHLNTENLVTPAEKEPAIYLVGDSLPEVYTPDMLLIDAMLAATEKEEKMIRQEGLPEFSAGYFYQQLEGTSGYDGVVAGISVPLWRWTNNSAIKQAQVRKQIYLADRENKLADATLTRERLVNNLTSLKSTLLYLSENMNERAEDTFKYATDAFDNGEINAMEYYLILSQTLNKQMTYLDVLQDYNETVIELNFLNIRL